ncbi:MAG: hypothetical protein C0594_13670 [Marinilabiliales bacterium]|nr:MAG: hypothetical protein C0594_13670 [Marinilabiliales bacterium]
MYHRRTGMDNVTSRPSFGNPTGTAPNLEDRAIFLLRNKNNQNRFYYNIDYYSLENTQDNL